MHELEMKQLGEVVGRLRTRANLSRRELEEKTGVSETTIQMVEIGKANPSIGTLVKIFDGLGYEIKINFVPVE